MGLIYGRGECIVKYSKDKLESVVIKYRGNPYLKHTHQEITHILNDFQARIRNPKSKSLLIHGYNQIHIGFIGEQESEFILFEYTGMFQILKASINEKEIGFEALGIDYPEFIRSKVENMGNPEQYKNDYTHGIGLARPKLPFKDLRKNKKRNGTSKIISNRSKY